MKNRSILPILTFLTVVALLGLDVFLPSFEVDESHIHLVTLLASTFGMGGIYIKAIEKGFKKFEQFKKSNKDGFVENG